MVHKTLCRSSRVIVLVGALVAAATGCRAGVAAVGPPATAGDTTAASPAAITTASSVATAPIGAGTGGAGSMTVGLTSPVAVAGHVDTPVSCETAARRYVESAAGSINGVTVTQSVRVAAYTGPGTYSALVTVSVAQADATRYAADAVPATVEVTATGGSLSFSAATDGGRTLAGTISWACS